MKVGRKPQDGWRSWVAPAKDAGSPAIETSERPSNQRVARLPDRSRTVPAAKRTEGGRVSSASVAGEKNTVEREPAPISPWAVERPSNERNGVGEPHERSRAARVGDSSRNVRRGSESLAWFRAEQTVEDVRNVEDGRCRWQRVVATGSYGRPIPSSAVGAQNPRRGAPALRRRVRL